MTARGLHGEAYRGHVFWDELYIFPFYNLHFPEVTRALLMYRYHRLEAAKAYAAENGYKGAMYPWQTADDGTEETQIVHFNPKDGSWGPDESRRQRHVSIAVFYNTWRYIKDSGDLEFRNQFGAEMLLEIALFWGSITAYDEETQKYHIQGVMGPDEFHEKLPGSEEHGIKDNAYTNIMVVWLLEEVLVLTRELPEDLLGGLREKIGFTEEDLTRWQDITRKMNVVMNEDQVLGQFEGYWGLEDLDWDHYRQKYGDIHRLDRILKAEGDSPDKYKLAKQADTLMTFYVLHPEQVVTILSRLGHDIKNSHQFLAANYSYYEKRTSHGSTLSRVVHAVISSYLHSGDTAWDWFMDAMRSDIYDTQGGTTLEGIHCGVMAGTLDIITRYFAGLGFSTKIPTVQPNLPAHWRNMSLNVVHQGIWYHFDFTHDQVTAKISGSVEQAVTVNIAGKECQLTPGKEVEVKI